MNLLSALLLAVTSLGDIPPYDGKNFVPEISGAKTGFFHTERTSDGKWWVIDPLGRGFGVFGVNAVCMDGQWTWQGETHPLRKANLRAFGSRENWEKEQQANQKIKENQLIHLSFVTNTDYKIDRLPSLVENIFGEGFILHERYALKDSNKNHRPVLVRYDNKWLYVIEAAIVLLFLAGVWCGRKERLMWMVMSMFLFDMLLHVGLNFASADVYIMTAHWAFVIPIAVAYLLKKCSAKPMLNTVVTAVVLFLTVFLIAHNMEIITKHILG